MPNDETKLSDSLLVLHQRDNIALLRRPLTAGTKLSVSGSEVALKDALGMGHKIATRSIKMGEDVLKYGAPIGYAASDIAIGEHIHLHNLKSRYTIIEDMDKNDE